MSSRVHPSMLASVLALSSWGILLRRDAPRLGLGQVLLQGCGAVWWCPAFLGAIAQGHSRHAYCSFALLTCIASLEAL